MRVELCITRERGGRPEPRTFNADIITIGRNPTCDLSIPEGTVSNLHGRIVTRNGRFFYQDLNSTNGTLLQRGEESYRVPPSAAEGMEIYAGDMLLLGDAAAPVKLLVSSLEYLGKKSEIAKEETIIARYSVNQEAALTNDARCLAALYTVLKSSDKNDEQGLALGDIADCLYRYLKGVKRVQFAFWKGEELNTAFRRSFGGHPEDESRGAPRAIAEEVRRRKEAVLFTDMDVEPISKSVAASKSPLFACAPMFTREAGDGILLVEAVDSSSLTPNDLELIAAVAGHAAVVVDRISVIDELKRARQKLRNENVYLKEQREREKEYEIIGESKAIEGVRAQIQRLAPNDVTVLITGETGTGKELAARALHYLNPKRRENLFIAVNCGAIPENLLESELFGHTKGSFTGAIANRQGMFALADGGTLFLDEIAEIPLMLQVKLLRALQDGEFWPIGAQKPQRGDVRLLSATNRDLQKEVAEGRFREDLYYRIKVIELHIPSLRERPEDIPILARHFLARLKEKRASSPSDFTPTAMAALSSHSFQGNIRELMNEVERAAVFASPADLIDVEHLSANIIEPEGEGEEAPTVEGEGYLKEHLQKFEKSLIESALREHGGNRTATAQFLGISRQALLMKMKKLDIQ